MLKYRMLKNPNLFTVSRLNQTARELLEQGLGLVSVEAEISNLAFPASGHWYFSLKDPKAQIRCAMFKGANSRAGFTPQDGDQIVVKGHISLYEPRGDYQLIVEKIEPVGNGALQRAFDQLKFKLEKEGLFDPEPKKEIPALPKAIGVITSPSGAAIHDILTVLKRRFPAIPVIIYPCTVQGETAAPGIIAALRTANDRAECDVLILARGGGSLEDLWCFNDENLAHTIFESDIPIVTGIGHEVDFTIADFVADQRAATPSAAAELVSPDCEHYKHLFENVRQQITSSIRYYLSDLTNQLNWLRKSLRHPQHKLQEQAQTLDRLQIQLQKNIVDFINNKQQKLALLASKLHAYSPLITLSRGYAIAKNEQGMPITSVDAVNIGDNILINLETGKLGCKVVHKFEL
jgi:exodeoxyribonuclease VII large subunit